jgi:FHS family L-fucose permease-like MFS transporter
MSPAAAHMGQRGALVALTSLFFMWGLVTSLNDILIPHLKAAFDLSYAQAMLVQFTFFGAYFVMSFPSGWLIERLGYRRGIMIGLTIAGTGCVLFYPAAESTAYSLFLSALFVLASGITLLQVAANPYVAVLGPPQTASSRLTLTQAFNSFGTTVGPFVGAMLILGGVSGSPEAEADAVQLPYLGLAAALFSIAAVFGRLRLPTVREVQAADDGLAPPVLDGETLWAYRHLLLGAVAIFVYVGAEVAIGSLLVNFMSSPDIGGLSAEAAGRYLSLYWMGAMIGRFLGAAVMRALRPGAVLAFNAAVAVVLLGVAMTAAGEAAMWAMLAIGLCNSIMFPTIFALAIQGLGKHTGEGSGLLCMAIVGGAVVPLVQGVLADEIGLLYSFVVPLVCYVYIVFYGLRGHWPQLRRLS